MHNTHDILHKIWVTTILVAHSGDARAITYQVSHWSHYLLSPCCNQVSHAMLEVRGRIPCTHLFSFTLQLHEFNRRLEWELEEHRNGMSNLEKESLPRTKATKHQTQLHMADHHTIKSIQRLEVELVEARVTIPNNQLELITLAEFTTTSSRIYFVVVFFLQQLQSLWI